MSESSDTAVNPVGIIHHGGGQPPLGQNPTGFKLRLGPPEIVVKPPESAFRTFAQQNIQPRVRLSCAAYAVNNITGFRAAAGHCLAMQLPCCGKGEMEPVRPGKVPPGKRHFVARAF